MRSTTFLSKCNLGNVMIVSISFAVPVGLGERKSLFPQGGSAMVWTSPVFEEVVLCCEINSYVSAKL